jgi:hypothetical protein
MVPDAEKVAHALLGGAKQKKTLICNHTQDS